MTLLAVILLAFILGNVMLLAKPAVAPDEDGKAAALGCYTSAWRGPIRDDHGSINWRITLTYEYRLKSTCQVEIRNVRCSSWSFGAGITDQKCSAWYDAYRLSGNIRTTARACAIGQWGICTDIQLWHKVSYAGWYVYREGMY